MTTMTLFDFAVEESTEEITFDELKSVFDKIAAHVKEKKNNIFCGVVVKEYIFKKNLSKYTPLLMEKGWLKESYDIPLVYRDFHTLDEVLDEISLYYDKLHLALDEYGVESFVQDKSWHDLTWRTTSNFIPATLAPTTEESLKMKTEIHKRKEVFEKDLAIRLGWKFYSKNEACRGSKVEKFTEKPYKQHFLPYFRSKVLEINDYDEMKSFLSKPFLMGRWDDWSEKNFPLPPRPVIEKVHCTPLEIACLVEANETNVDKIIKTVLTYSGGSGSLNDDFIASINHNPNYTMKTYEESLSIEDQLALIDDIERLKKLKSIK